jgi:hypothetical protein
MRTLPATSYWTLAGLLILFGIVGGFGVGIPFLLLGFALVALAPIRRRAEAFWPLFGAAVTFAVTYAVLSPLGCDRLSLDKSPSIVTCTNPVGIVYRGRGDAYDPSHVPALLAGVAAAALVAWSIRALIRRAQSATASGELAAS